MKVRALKLFLAEIPDDAPVQLLGNSIESRLDCYVSYGAADTTHKGVMLITPVDQYTQKATELFSLNVEQVAPWHREKAKRYMLARQFGCTHEQAWEIVIARVVF